jgi:hypothetical protein
MFSQLDRNNVGHPVRMMEMRGSQSGVFGSRQPRTGRLRNRIARHEHFEFTNKHI